MDDWSNERTGSTSCAHRATSHVGSTSLRCHSWLPHLLRRVSREGDGAVGHHRGMCLLVVVAGLRFCRDSFFLFIFFICQLPSELSERNSTETGHVFASECNLKMHVPKFGVSPASKNQQPKTAYFRRFSTTSQLNGNFNGHHSCILYLLLHS